MTENTTTATRVTGIMATDLDNVLRNVMTFAAKDDTLPILSSVHLTVHGDSLVAEATDRYAVAFGRVATGDHVDPKFDALISVADVKRILPMLKGYAAMTVDLTIEDHDTLRVKTWDSETTTRLVDGEFPKVKGLMTTTEFDSREQTGPKAYALAPWQIKRLGAVKDYRERRSIDNPLSLGMPEASGKPVMFTFGDWLTGMVMPIRLSNHGDTVKTPDWFGQDATGRGVETTTEDSAAA